MKCPKCQFENPEGMKFCVECGQKLEIICSKCGFINSPDFKFCGECGSIIEPEDKLPSDPSEHEPLPSIEPKDAPVEKITSLEGERKHATVLFSDLSGYTAMSEKLDPEKVKEIMGHIFTEAGRIAEKYDATVEKFFGDEIMILFGVPKAHEDDPLRAINVALEIHQRVEEIRPKYKEETGADLQMHTGINTGLVVTGDKYIGKSRYGLTGNTINLAKRLTGLAGSDEIMVGPDTYHQSSGYFNFEDLKPTKVKGKTEPVRVYRVVSPKARPRKIHRLQGVRAELIGRKVEMDQLKEAEKKLRKGQGAAFSIVGTAGTGKSRLIEEFKASLNLKKIQWREGHSYPYTQNISYFPLINLLSRAFGIKEGDSPEKLKEKISSGIAYLMGEDHEAIPYIGSLFSLNYSEIEGVSPEFWKSKLQQSIQSILSGLAQKRPTIICLEDLHWADPSFLELIRLILADFRNPVLFLCVYRPIITLFTSHQITSIANPFQEIHIQDLSTSESQDMLESLLKTKHIPDELRRFVQTKVEGNPFYLEEVINSFIESETLIKKTGNWHVTRSITTADISASIHSIISARLDRLDLETKRILQQAAVIGRAFYYEILKKITNIKENIDECLRGLERLDLIKMKSVQPDLEYIFKHALTQEVVYDGLLMKERREIHERIAIVIEQLFRDRLPEFYETLAFHFKQGESIDKAIDYLMKAGEKSLKRYALEESHQYYQEAFDLLTEDAEKSKENHNLLIDLLSEWSLVYYYRGDFKGLTDLLRNHEQLASSITDNYDIGMYFAWYGFMLFARERNREALHYLKKALQIGEKYRNFKTIGYVYAWLAFVYSELGLMKKAIQSAERSQEIYRNHEPDQYIYFKSLLGMAVAYWYRGDYKKVLEIGHALLDFGHKHSNISSLTAGQGMIGVAYFMDGDFLSAIEFLQKAIALSVHPIYSHGFKAGLGFSYILNGQFQEAEITLQENANFCKKFGYEIYGAYAEMGLCINQIVKGGQIGEGFNQLKECQRVRFNNRRKYYYAMAEHILGKLYSQIALGEGDIKPFDMVKNIGFLIKNVPLARKKAETHLYEAIELSMEIGAKGLVGQAYLDLGILKKKKNQDIKAKECIFEAIKVFEKCESEFFLKQAKELLESDKKK